MGKQKVSPQLDCLISRRYLGGEKPADIAVDLGLGTMTIRASLIRTETPLRTRSQASTKVPALTPDQDQEVVRMYSSGMTMDEIAQYFDLRSSRAIKKSLRRTGTKTRKTGAPGKRNVFWKGGRNLDADGYVRLHLPDHPYARKGYVLEHRLVVEKILGRYLDPEEVVHHRNDNKQDNRPENLLVFANNAEHLMMTLRGKCPKWTREGRLRLSEALKQQKSKKGIPRPPAAPDGATSRRKIREEVARDTSESWDSGVEAKLPQRLSSLVNQKKKRGTAGHDSTAL